MDKNKLISYINNIMDASEKLSNASGALTAYITEYDENIDDAYWNTLDQIKDCEFSDAEEAADAILEIFK